MGTSSSIGLACCHGYVVAAGGLEVGRVETPIFSGALREPEFLLVRTSPAIAGTFRFVPSGLVVELDREGRRLELAGDGASIAALPESLPLARVDVEA
jgi:hypothetical protein